MQLAEQLRILQAAEGHPAKLALASVDLAYPDVADLERETLRQSLEAAAIPHWCNADMLSALLVVPTDDAAARLSKLWAVPVVEPFPARGESALNVHQASRLALRKHLTATAPERFRTLSARAAAYLADDHSPAGRIEWMFHLLSGDPDRGADALDALNREWGSSARPEDFFALAAALKELEDAGLVQGRARVWVLLVIGWGRVLKEETAQLDGVANEALEHARAMGDLAAEADALCLLGRAVEAQGRLEQARTAFDASLAIVRRLAGQDPAVTGRQRDMAVALNAVGDVLQAQGNFLAAQRTTEESLGICRRLAEQDPNNVGWQRELAVAIARVGNVLEARGQLPAAQKAFEESLAISRRLVEQDPSSTGWQRDVAVVLSRIGGVLNARSEVEAAHATFNEYLAIFRHLTELDPNNAGWQRELATALGWVGSLLEARGDLGTAQMHYEESLAISRRMVERDGSNATWQHDLALAAQRVAQIEASVGQFEAAISLGEESVAILYTLSETLRANNKMESDLIVIKENLEYYKRKRDEERR